jgi:ferredoxin
MSRLRIVVNRELCESNAVCEKLAPAVFHVDEGDLLQVRAGAPSDEELAAVKDAVRLCPRQALSLVDDG